MAKKPAPSKQADAGEATFEVSLCRDVRKDGLILRARDLHILTQEKLEALPEGSVKAARKL